MSAGQGRCVYGCCGVSEGAGLVRPLGWGPSARGGRARLWPAAGKGGRGRGARQVHGSDFWRRERREQDNGARACWWLGAGGRGVGAARRPPAPHGGAARRLPVCMGRHRMRADVRSLGRPGAVIHVSASLLFNRAGQVRHRRLCSQERMLATDEAGKQLAERPPPGGAAQCGAPPVVGACRARDEGGWAFGAGAGSFPAPRFGRPLGRPHSSWPQPRVRP
jgi:hypothetical protein